MRLFVFWKALTSSDIRLPEYTYSITYTYNTTGISAVEFISYATRYTTRVTNFMSPPGIKPGISRLQGEFLNHHTMKAVLELWIDFVIQIDSLLPQNLSVIQTWQSVGVF